MASERDALPTEVALDQNFPNPFNPTTTVQFSLPRASRVTLNIYDSLGKHVRTLVSGDYLVGTHTAVWDGTNDQGKILASGVYFYTLSTGQHKSQKKLLLLK